MLAVWSKRNKMSIDNSMHFTALHNMEVQQQTLLWLTYQSYLQLRGLNMHYRHWQDTTVMIQKLQRTEHRLTAYESDYETVT